MVDKPNLKKENSVADARVLSPRVADGVPEISVEDLWAHFPEARAGKLRLIDVRRAEEFNNELGHVEGARLLTLGPELTEFLESGNRAEEIVFICRSGVRSATATSESIRLGYQRTVNLIGGMLRWNEKKLPTAKD